MNKEIMFWKDLSGDYKSIDVDEMNDKLSENFEVPNLPTAM